VEWEGQVLSRGQVRVWVNLRISLLRDGAQKPLYFIITLEDVTERKQVHAEMERIAFHDALTGLPNRRLFNRQLTQALEEASEAGTALAVLFLDLDRFKQVNDSLGHVAGDSLLEQASERIRKTLSGKAFLARLGGDEFGMVVTGVASVDAAAGAAQSVVEAFEAPLRVEGGEMYVTASVGVSMYPRDGSTPEALMKNADSAMYRAKEKGRNQFSLYKPVLSLRVEERLSLEQSLRRAQERNELHLLYQPQFRLGDGALVASEVLVRWNHPSHGLVTPERFIPLAEDTGLIPALGEWVLRASCHQTLDWREQGLPVVPNMVNLSLIQLRTDDLLGIVTRILDETGLDPHFVGVELTENVACVELDATVELLNRLHGLGIRIVMDDFGRGYSSLSRLKHLPLDSVKIDKAFVDGIPDDPDDVAIMRAIIALAKTLNLAVVAEGVERPGQAALLRELECDVAQGFLFGRPMPARDFESLLRAGRCPQLAAPGHD
jgi:diguanylate cyclase (GGDEF)-like protein